MTGIKGPRAKDDKTKKRKRDINESDIRSKRHRQQSREAKVNGDDVRTPPKLKQGKPNKENLAVGLGAFRQQEVIRQSDDGEAGWRVSKPMGGRMLDIDPILTEDEQYLILTYNTSLQVFNANDSLLVRRIPISTLDTSASKGATPAHIVATRLSKHNTQLAWVACSDGNIYCVNWTQGDIPTPAFQTSSSTAKALAVIPAAFTEHKEILLVAESEKPSRMDVVAYQLVDGDKQKSASILTLQKPGYGLQILETSDDGQVIVGAFQDRLFLATASATTAENLDQLRYETFSFDSPDLITSIDMRLHPRFSGNKKGHVGTDTAVDVIIGGARGGIYVYRDALSHVMSAGKAQFVKDGIQVQKYHWHRKAVHAVKWSADGNYFISGGSENVLVIWQVDTSRKDFLPHLSGSVENIVVSHTGSSYVVHLDDNSAMILSTAEMKPTAYIAGIQSAAVDVSEPKDLLVRRVWNISEHSRRPIPAAIRPSEPSKFYVCVGNGRQETLSGNLSMPLMQSFDLESFTSISKQALARTQPTDVNLSSRGHPIDEPIVTNIAFSGDGKWLASIDEWKPAPRDVENISPDLRVQFMRERHEIYLKFWQVRDGAESMDLVSRINAPHSTTCPESVLDLASDPTSNCFATVGTDGIIRLWRPRPRQQNGVALKDATGQDAVSWGCVQVIGVGDGTGIENGTDFTDPTQHVEVQGRVVFSEDGSTLFVAFGAVDSGAIYVVDVASGQIVKTLEGLWDGRLQSLQALGSFIIVLSNDLRVYDVVGDGLQYGIVVPKLYGVNELHQLAVDHTSGRFAVTLPIGGASSIGVFDPEDPEPLLVRSTPHRIVSLVSAPGASGFIALDDAAQVWVIAEGSDPSSIATVQPLQDLQLDGCSGAVATDTTTAEVLETDETDAASEDDTDDAKEADDDVDMGDDDEDDAYGSVIPQQSLTEIFDAAPAFAAPSIEDMFYKVTGLLARKPVAEQ
ncbi:WD repeat-containing protein 75 [Metarhizium album ARSEF 1941]|uniref:WD repeat-containing protein 75 n=1 Tax=Metarhizium album (strain ARSEF 1941) TaxID=1081103 RepID=A0A0B2WTJ5_METAS|nr:WD repeat-containing protein 75 [Metarhizium album ARSEF 1941]KHN96782.1 WD repeat-containing protein 75 [Metarhizium album ARSEF 1941]